MTLSLFPLGNNFDSDYTEVIEYIITYDVFQTISRCAYSRPGSCFVLVFNEERHTLSIKSKVSKHLHIVIVT